MTDEPQTAPYCFGCGRENASLEQARHQHYWCTHCIRAAKHGTIDFGSERFLFPGEPLRVGDVRIDADIQVLPNEGVKYGEFGLYKRRVSRWGTTHRVLDKEEEARPGDLFASTARGSTGAHEPIERFGVPAFELTKPSRVVIREVRSPT